MSNLKKTIISHHDALKHCDSHPKLLMDDRANPSRYVETGALRHGVQTGVVYVAVDGLELRAEERLLRGGSLLIDFPNHPVWLESRRRRGERNAFPSCHRTDELREVITSSAD